MAVSESSLVEEVPRNEIPEPVGHGPYASSDEHLHDELRRIDLLIRAQTIRWQTTIASTKPEQLWGMVHVTDAEVAAYLQSNFVPPGYLPAPLVASLKAYWHEARQLEHTIRERVAATSAETILRLERLTSRCGLSDLERNILLLCLLAEVDGRYRRLLGYLQDDVSRTNPTVELVLQILSPAMNRLETGRSCFAPESKLIRQHLLVLIGDDVLSMRSVRVDRHVVDYLLGTERLDGRVAAVSFAVEPVSWDELILEPELLEKLQAFASWWGQETAPAGATLFLHGPGGVGRLRAAQATCATAGLPLLVIEANKVARAAPWIEKLIDLVYREASLRGLSVYWSNCEVLLDAQMPAQVWEYLIDATPKFNGLVFLESNAHWEPAGEFHEHIYQRFDFQSPAYNLRRHLWETLLPNHAEFLDQHRDRQAVAEQLANGFQLTRGQILSVLDTARELALQRNPHNPLISVNDLYEGCRRQSYRQLVTFAWRIEPRTELTFTDLVMPEPSRRQLMELRARIKHRSQVYAGLGFERRLSLGKGLIALFTGSSGTGKTMAAELLAREQGVDLYKVDLSAVVSKYVGETEKNLSRVFAEAEDANAIIFFDEADALFGKRGEVKEAQDRWANMEVNYLLQRVEEYAGVVILASNLRQNIDEAFMRRIHVIVEFPFPEASARLRILSGLFPRELDHPADVELQSISDRFKLSGGSLKNIVLDAAFRALSENGQQPLPNITLRHLVLGAVREYQKLGKPITRGEFGDDFFKWVEEIL
jgi:hypothetical protein